MIQFDFKLSSFLFNEKELFSRYSLEYLNDWLSYESELKYLFFFGDSDESFDVSTVSYPKSIEDIINLLRHNTILSNTDKQFILSIYIEDAYVYTENNIAMLRVILDSEFKKVPINSNIVQFLLNHIYNQSHDGLFKNGVIRPLTEEEKKKYHWSDEVGWSQQFLEDQMKRSTFDSLFFSNYTFLCDDTSLLPKDPIYLSNYNSECYQISKCIELVNNDMERYSRSIKFLKKKKKELRKEKKSLYTMYRNTYLTMLDNGSKKWKIQLSSATSV